MDRRRFLSVASFAGIGSFAGCVSAQLGASGAVDFELWNKTDESHRVDVTIKDAEGETVLNQFYEIGQAGSGSTPGGTVIRETGFTEATPDEFFDAVALLDEEVEHEHRFQATCVNTETVDVFLIEIEPGKETNLQFNQSTCS